MNKLSTFLLFSILLIVSCKNTKNESIATQSRWDFDSLRFEKMIYLDGDSAKQGLKLTLKFDYPSSFENDSILKIVQSHFLAAFTEDSSALKLTPTDGFAKFTEYNVAESLELCEEVKSIGASYANYYKTIKTSVVDTTALTITGETQTLQYSGGAHDSRYVAYFNIDIRTGKLIALNDLFKSDTDQQIVALIKEVLKTTKNANGDIVTLFEPDDVEVSPNFYFNTDGVVFVYNTYEISPHSDGLVQAVVPYSKLKDIFAADYAEIINIKTKNRMN